MQNDATNWVYHAFFKLQAVEFLHKSGHADVEDDSFLGFVY